MSSRHRTFSFRRYKPIPTTGSELNRKFDSDIRRSMDLLERQRRQQPQQQQQPPGSSPVGAKEYLPQSGVPTLITTSRDTSSKQNLLRTKSTHSNATTTQKMYIASQQNGIVVTSTRRMESYTIQKQRSTAETTVADESTLPTFMSVGASISYRHTTTQDMSRSPSFLVSEGDNKLSSSPLLRLDAIKIKPERGASVPVLGNSDRETRKKLHYKEKLRALTDRLTTSSAVERSKTMLSSIVIGQSAVLQMNEVDEVGCEEKAEKGDTPASKSDLINGMKKKVLDPLSKLFNCSLTLCVDDSVLDHEGMIISMPTTPKHSSDVEEQGEDDDEDYTAGEYSDISSLTGPTNFRFRSRYAYWD